MKLSETLPLNNTLQEIYAAIKISAPGAYPFLFKVIVAENVRLALPKAQEFVNRRDGLMKMHAEAHPTAKPDDPKPEDTEAQKIYEEEMRKIFDEPVNTQFRHIYESELKEAPLTMDQISILQQFGILVKNETPKTPVEPAKPPEDKK